MENDKVWVVILKFSISTTLKTTMKFDPNLNLKIFNLPNNKFKSILNFQIKSSFPNIALVHCIYYILVINVLIVLIVTM